MNIKRIIHIGVAVADMEQVKKLYTDILGLSVGHSEVYQDMSDICFLPVGDSQIELFADIRPGGLVSQIIAEQGVGIHHIAFEVEDIEAAMRELKAKGMSVLDEKPKPGAHGTKVAFLDPSATHGVLIELVQQARECMRS